MWNRIGAAAVLVVFLLAPGFRQKVFAVDKIENKTGTSLLFLFKQVLGGLNFVFYSFLLVIGTISIVNGLQGFRYVFLLLFSLLLTKKRQHLIDEDVQNYTLTQKIFGIILISFRDGFVVCGLIEKP